jgi:hypothetical protein
MGGAHVTQGARPGGWNDFWRDVARRTREPAHHATYVFFFAASVVIIGCLGIWLELFLLGHKGWGDAGNLKTAIATFFPALIGSTCLQIIFGQYLRQLKAFSIVFTLIFAGISIGLLVENGLRTWAALLLGALSSIASLWFWWIANADNSDYFDEQSPTASIGGDNPTGELAGSLAGFDS